MAVSSISTTTMTATEASSQNDSADPNVLPHSLPTSQQRSGGPAVSRQSESDRAMRRSLSGSESYVSVSRLISETAHDLRAPLSTIREAVRLVRDGDLGQVNSEQRECLSAAINQCNCAAQLVDEMVQSRRFDTGFPNVRRDWMLIDDLQKSVQETLQPWMMPREIQLLWDGPFRQGVKTYADATLLRRLIVNLAGNAIRVTRDGGAVLIRTKIRSDHAAMVWSVVDQGQGISPADMELIACGKAPAKSVGGLGLLISRQLAAAHFSDLRIESRLGTGTAVSFQTTIGGPAAVASRWVDWRSTHGGADSDTQAMPDAQRVREVLPARSFGNADSQVPRRVRIDVPSQAIELGIDDVQPAFQDHAYLASVSVGAATPASGTDAFDALLQRSLRITELAYRTGRRSWVVAWDADVEAGIAKRMELERLVQNELDALRMTWGDASVVNLSAENDCGPSLVHRLSEMMVRQTLAAAQHSVSDADQVRLGTAPMIASPIPSVRLQSEVEWLRESRLARM